MEPFDSSLNLKQQPGAQGLANCHVFASAHHLAHFERRLGAAHPALTLHPLASDGAVPSGVLKQAQCVVLEINPADPVSLSRMEQVRRARPTLPIIAAIENADFNLARVLVRQGVFDVVALPFDVEEVLSRIIDASAITASSTPQHLAPMIAIVGATAGIGATTVVTHLAGAVASMRTSARCCIIDLDLQFGDVANYLGVEGHTSVLDLLEAGERLDGDLVRNAAVESTHGVAVLAPPAAITPLEMVDVDQLLRLLQIARQEYGLVFVDLPANWTNWSLSAVIASSEIMLVVDQTLAGLRQARRTLDLFQTVEMPGDAVNVIVNRFEKRVLHNIGLREVEQTLRHPVRSSLAREKNGLVQAQDQGLLLPQVVRKTKFGGDVEVLASELHALEGASR